ncbi:MAG TPA: hypothetical protein PKX32_02170 [Candidatus Saccharicenans sp.]|jgi:hypothetical protein|nr:hypothetical protein [Candidatus Saccharicenans sp.]
MKKTKKAFLFLVLGLILAWPAAISAQIITEKYGQGVFANSDGPIKLVVDARMAIKDIKSSYVMFIAYMAAGQEGQSIVVDRNGITMIYQGAEYKMPSVKELRQNYHRQMRDTNFYQIAGKENLASTWVRFYKFPTNMDFFPLQASSSPLVDECLLTGYIGFRTRCYFKNPGFKKGDQIIIRVTAKGDPALSNEVMVVLE